MQYDSPSRRWTYERDERGLTCVCQTVETLKGDFKGGIKQNMMNLAAVSFRTSVI
jgi:hypothetical protein